MHPCQDRYPLKFFRHSLLYICFSTLMATTLPSVEAYAESILAREYFLKAAFLYNFARLVDWPDNSLQTTDEPFTLCLIGKDPFAQALRPIRNKKVRGHPLNIKRNISLDQIQQCHMLFISRSEQDRLQEILQAAAAYPILTVSELADFAEHNGHIRLFLNNDEKLSLEVNLNAIRAQDLTISSRILSLARIVSSTEEKH